MNTCRDSIKLKEFGLEYHNPRDFVTLKFGSPKSYLIWTSCWAFYHTVWICLEGYYWSTRTYPEERWFAFLTNLAYLSIAVLAAVELAIAIYVNKINNTIYQDPYSQMTWFLKFQWILYTIAYSQAIVITPAFWVMLHIYKWPGTINKHGINTIYTLLCILLTARPIKCQHAYIAILFSFSYMFFSYIYFLSGGPIIYNFLNWNKPSSALLWAILYTFVATTLAQFSLFGIYKLRVYIWNRCRNNGINSVNSTEEERKVNMQKYEGVNQNMEE